MLANSLSGWVFHEKNTKINSAGSAQKVWHKRMALPLLTTYTLIFQEPRIICSPFAIKRLLRKVIYVALLASSPIGLRKLHGLILARFVTSGIMF